MVGPRGGPYRQRCPRGAGSDPDPWPSRPHPHTPGSRQEDEAPLLSPAPHPRAGAESILPAFSSGVPSSTQGPLCSLCLFEETTPTPHWESNINTVPPLPPFLRGPRRPGGPGVVVGGLGVLPLRR